MIFTVLNDDIACQDLLKVIEENYRHASMTREQIKRLRLESQNVTRYIEEETEAVEDGHTFKEEDDDFEDEASFFLNDYKALKENFTEEEMLQILPPKSHPEFQNIINRLLAESIREIKEIRVVLLEDKKIEKDELLEFQELIQLERRKMSMISSILKKEKTHPLLKEKKNKLLLVPTSYGNIRVLDDFKRIPSSYYCEFQELLNSIINGTFKGLKNFTNNRRIEGISEVRLHQTRIFFKRLNQDTYAIISAIVKKVNSKDKFYHDSLAAKVSDYRSMESFLKEQLKNQEFIEINDQNIQELWNLLKTDEVKNASKKGEKNDKRKNTSIN